MLHSACILMRNYYNIDVRVFYFKRQGDRQDAKSWICRADAYRLTER
jgi:hypothetical protein